MPNYDFDLFTIGGGSGGVRASRKAGGFGAKVGVAEERYLGGTCVNVGCVPKKLFTYAAHYAEDFEDAAAYGWQVGERRFDWPTLIANKNKQIEFLNGVYERLLTGAGCEIFRARAELVDAHTVNVGGKRVTAKYILIATGGWPSVPEFKGNNLAITSNEAFHFDTLPERILIGGGGYIAVELAGIFTGMGSRVTLVHRRDLLLRGFDEDLRRVLTREIRKRGVNLRMPTTVERAAKTNTGISVQLENGDELEVDKLLCCFGRQPLTDGLGLAAAGVRTNDKGAILVDDAFQTSVPNIYAVGDVIDRVKLTPVALAEGTVVACHLFGDRVHALSYDNIPSTVFCNPNVGTVGLSEAQARERYGAIDVYTSEFRDLKQSLPRRDTKTFMKLVVDQKSDRVVGCHMVGPDAGDIIQGFAVALNCGATKAQFDATVGIHPTAAEEFVTMRDKRA